MSDYCEICESLVLLQTECPATDVIMISAQSAAASSAATVGVQPFGVVVSSGVALGGLAEPESAFLLLTDSAGASSTAPRMEVVSLLGSTVRSKSAVSVWPDEEVTDNVVVHGGVAGIDTPLELTAQATATSSLPHIRGQATELLTASVAVSGHVQALGLEEAAVGSVAASSVLPWAERVVDVLCVVQSSASDYVEGSSTPSLDILTSVVSAHSDAQANCVLNTLVSSRIVALVDMWYIDLRAKAWVMNTETTAVCWYDNYAFESIMSWGGRELAVGAEGIYELTGDSDHGRDIDATVVSGFVDFGTPQTKRLDNMYFGYTSDGTLAMKAEVYDSGHPPSVYILEERAAEAPRNTRVTPGKGLWGRYWRLTLGNVSGADFDFRDADVDIAVSSRRI